jgi:hypothetical protein
MVVSAGLSAAGCRAVRPLLAVKRFVNGSLLISIEHLPVARCRWPSTLPIGPFIGNGFGAGGR